MKGNLTSGSGKRRADGGSQMESFEDRYKGIKGIFQVIPQENPSEKGPAKSVEGWILFVTGLHEEADEDAIYDLFCEVALIKNLRVNLDKMTGRVKGYGLVEYQKKEQAEQAIKELNGRELYGKKLTIDWAFKKDGSN